MSATHTSLDAAAIERKARLAKLKSLKRKQAPDEQEDTGEQPGDEAEKPDAVTTTYLSGRNYDASTKGPKLGFETGPAEDQETLEKRAEEIAEATRKQAEQDEKDEKPIDLFKLQPKKPNWDLKRDLARKMERLNVQTDNAIARIVRERIADQKRKQLEKANGNAAEGGDGEAVGMQGQELAEAVKQRELEYEEDERR